MFKTINRRQLLSIIIVASLMLVSIPAAINPVEAQNSEQNETVYSCDDVKLKVEQLLSDFAQKRDNHIEKYEEVSQLYGSIMTRLAEADYNTVILKELQPGLERRAAHFEETSKLFLSELTDVHDSACRDKNSFNLELTEARTALKDVQTSAAEIQNYVQGVLLSAINNTVENGSVDQ